MFEVRAAQRNSNDPKRAEETWRGSSCPPSPPSRGWMSIALNSTRTAARRHESGTARGHASSQAPGTPRRGTRTERGAPHPAPFCSSLRREGQHLFIVPKITLRFGRRLRSPEHPHPVQSLAGGCTDLSRCLGALKKNYQLCSPGRCCPGHYGFLAVVFAVVHCCRAEGVGALFFWGARCRRGDKVLAQGCCPHAPRTPAAPAPSRAATSDAMCKVLYIPDSELFNF